MIRSRLGRFAALGVIAALTLTGCAIEDEALEEVDETAPAAEEEAAVEDDVFRHPLTGEEVDPATVTGPAIMAKIDHENRPYVNLQRADIVWQQVIPQNGTRFIAIWHSDIPEEVAYVRSFRPHDLYMATPFGGIMASTGLFQGVVPYLEALGQAGVRNYVWDYRTEEDRDLWRVADKAYAAASSVVFNALDAHEINSELAPPQQYFQYSSDPAEASAVVDGEAISAVTAYFSQSKTNNYMTSSWQWDAAEGVFKKVFVDGTPVVVESGEQLSATNLVIISVEHDDTVGQPTARMQNGSGPAWVATGGKIMEVDWEKGALADPIKLTYDGTDQEVLLTPGKTWILVFPGDASTAQTAGWGGPGGIEYQ